MLIVTFALSEGNGEYFGDYNKLSETSEFLENSEVYFARARSRLCNASLCSSCFTGVS